MNKEKVVGMRLPEEEKEKIRELMGEVKGVRSGCVAIDSELVSLKSCPGTVDLVRGALTHLLKGEEGDLSYSNSITLHKALLEVLEEAVKCDNLFWFCTVMIVFDVLQQHDPMMAEYNWAKARGPHHMDMMWNLFARECLRSGVGAKVVPVDEG
jgi:hypothetical protein